MKISRTQVKAKTRRPVTWLITSSDHQHGETYYNYYNYYYSIIKITKGETKQLKHYYYVIIIKILRNVNETKNLLNFKAIFRHFSCHFLSICL